MEKFDLVVIGGGPSGYAAAMRAIDLRKKVLLVEREKVGGAAIYDGALTSKTLWEVSQKIAAINDTIVRHGKDKFELSWDEVQQTVHEAVFDRKIQYSAHITLLQNESENSLFKYERGFGKLLSKNKVQITKLNGNTFEVETEFILISTGSRPRYLPHIPIDENVILTSNGIHHIKDFPESLVILGAGVIGCEYATMFSNFGKTKVHLIDKADRILPFEDEDIARLIESNLRDKGVVIHNEANLEQMKIVNGKVEFELSYNDKPNQVFTVEKGLVSVGRVPNVENIGMETVGVSMSKRGRHIGDDDTQTNIPNIYVAGDASGRIALVNMGEIEGRHAVEKMFGAAKGRLSYDNVCTIMFTHPEVAAVGLNEQECIRQNIPIKVVKLDFSLIARAIAMRKTQGFFKIIVTNDEKMTILGMRAIGEHASSAIQGVALLIQMGEGIEELAELVHPHPSIIEGVQDCVRMLLNKSVFKSAIFDDRLKCYSIVDNIKKPLNGLEV